MLVCSEFMGGHGLHGTRSVAGYEVWGGGREPPVNERRSLCMLSAEMYFCE